MKREISYKELEERVASLSNLEFKNLKQIVLEREKKEDIFSATIFCLDCDEGSIWFDSYADLFDFYYGRLALEAKEISKISRKEYEDVFKELEMKYLFDLKTYRFDYLKEYHFLNDVFLKTDLKFYNFDSKYEASSLIHYDRYGDLLKYDFKSENDDDNKWKRSFINLTNIAELYSVFRDKGVCFYDDFFKEKAEKQNLSPKYLVFTNRPKKRSKKHE